MPLSHGRIFDSLSASAYIESPESPDVPDWKARELLFRNHLSGMAADGEAVPEPSSLEAVMADAENRDGVAILVRAPDRVRKVVRVNVSFDEDDLAEIDAKAERLGMTRSGLLSRAARQLEAA